MLLLSPHLHPADPKISTRPRSAQDHPAGQPKNAKVEFNSRCEKAGVRRIRVHDTRHTCASLLPALDVHPRVAMAILRHAQIAITMEIYTEVPDEVTRAALKRLGDQLTSRDQAPGQAGSPQC